MGPDPENIFFYDVSNNIPSPKSAIFVNRGAVCSVRQGVKKWTFSMLWKVLMSQNGNTLYNDHVSVHFSDEQVDGHGVFNKKL